VTHEEAGRAFVYRPAIGRNEAARSAVGHVLDRFFASSPGALAVTLIDDAELTHDDLAEIQRVLARKRKSAK
jgi:predicted transcriptional regulator